MESCKKKVLFVATVVKTHIMEFHIPYLRMFKEMGWETAVAARNDYDNPADCVIPSCDTYYNVPFERNPLKPANLKAYQVLKKIIDEGDYDIIHCHTPVGAMLARLAARNARKKGTRVIYTAHGFHFYKGAPLLNWLVYYPVEKWLARYTDVLITINQEDYERARKKFGVRRIEYVPGVGIDTGRFHDEKANLTDRVEIRGEFHIPDDSCVLLSVGELNRNKNHRVVIEALTKLKKTFYVICGRGPLAGEYRELAKKTGVSDRLILTGYRTDVQKFYHAADVFVFPSLREGLPVSVMEAMASGLPVVCTGIRGSSDLVDSRGGCQLPPGEWNRFPGLIEKAYQNRDVMGQYNCRKAENYSLARVLETVKKIYISETEAVQK